MSEPVNRPTAHLCPECGTPRAADNSPSCDCTRRASDALQATRTTEAAAAEDFDPLRIRPYVDLATGGDDSAPDVPPGTGEAVRDGSGTQGGADRPGRARRAAEAGSDAHGGTGSGGDSGRAGSGPDASRPGAMSEGDGDSGAPDGSSVPDRHGVLGSPGGSGSSGAANLPAAEATMPLRTVAAPEAPADTQGTLSTPTPPPTQGRGELRDQPPPTRTRQQPHTPTTDTASAHSNDNAEPTVALPRLDPTTALPAPDLDDLRLFNTAEDGNHPENTGDNAPPGRRRRRTLLGIGGAVVAVVAAGGFASGLLTYEAPSREGAPPKDVRAAVPEAPVSATAESPAPETPPAPPTSAPPPPTASETPTTSPSPSASTTSAPPSPSPTAEPTRAPTTPPPGAEAGAGAAASEAGRQTGPVLRTGDKGPEVTELQQRLSQLRLYDDEIDGEFTSEVEKALRTYQGARNVGTDNLGVYDHETRTALEAETTEP
ncbi:peptidoglycan-binding domain-containing protein [Streptomyces sp. YU58]|uniref:peptidoglycan-binding domain-containing protein n=1 Tax=Streptomyces sp. SX92 TaxID=3158972 RepID=UPI0027B8BC4E|nr:peptidoglycan-binding domain-containing protein [Streptomyces coralus]WLW55454.1 peptidoglycan-binding domain-containing protein [Streptomyces coralus]